jgi:hypothetical protein
MHCQMKSQKAFLDYSLIIRIQGSVSCYGNECYFYAMRLKGKACMWEIVFSEIFADMHKAAASARLE